MIDEEDAAELKHENRRTGPGFKLAKFFERAAGAYKDGRLDNLLPKESEEEKR